MGFQISQREEYSVFADRIHPGQTSVSTWNLRLVVMSERWSNAEMRDSHPSVGSQTLHWTYILEIPLRIQIFRNSDN